MLSLDFGLNLYILISVVHLKMLCPIEFYDIPDPLQCNIIAVYDDSIEKENAILTREEFSQQLAQLREENKIERLQELEETWSAILRVHDHVKANHAVNERKIGNLEDKVGDVYQKVEELNSKVDNLSRKCQSLKQRMVEEIPEITEIKARNKLMGHCTSITIKSLNFNFLYLGNNGKDQTNSSAQPKCFKWIINYNIRNG
jgi:hypothetical protein